ncbi:MAG: Dabb family protein [Deltaproteobacteria bacterium]|nr:Dabb family protein [Deltaproteobacteria bacterium]
MLNHVVLLKFKPDVADGDIEQLEERLDDLPNKISEILVYEFGRNIIPSERAYDFALVSLFANQESLERYRVHPDHVVVLEKIKGMCEQVVTADFLGSDAGSIKGNTPDMALPRF